MEFEVDGIRYNVNEDGRTVSVISNNYEGEVTIPSSVEYNGNEYSVTAIGRWAFDGCSGLTNIVIPNSVTVIGDMAFRGCGGLTSVVISVSVTKICRAVFVNCSGLESIIVEKGNPVYDSRENCNAIIETKTNKLISGCKNTIIPDMVTEIGELAFGGCCGLTSIVIPDSVTAIGELAFGGCCGLTSVVIPDSVTEIGYRAFWGCSGLTSVVIPNSVTAIGGLAFRGCSGLTSAVIPNSVTEIGNGTFLGCSGLISIVIPDSVTEIGDVAFRGCIGLTSVVIPDSVTEIGDVAFNNCSGLTSIIIPNSVTEIGAYAFNGCSGLESIIVEKDNPVYDSRENCNAIIETKTKKLVSGCKSTIIPNSVTAIGDWAFSRCRGLTSVVIPDSVTEIGKWAFANCSEVESIVVDNDNPVYDSRENCNAIIETKTNKLISGCKNTIIPDSVTEIGYRAFDGCSSLTSVVIPDSVTEIGDSAFDGCSVLASVVIPNSVSKIGDSAFWDCSGLTSVVIPDSVTEIGKWAFYGCSGLTSVVIPDSVTEIGYGAFKGCIGLTTLVFNAESCRLDKNACSNCDNLNTIVIGRKVKCFPKEFLVVTSLRNVIVLAQEPPKCEVLISDKNNITVHVPKESYVKYWLDDYWRNFNLCEFVPVESISLSEKDVYLNLDGQDTLQATISPTNATLKQVTWHSENLEVVTIDQEGNIYGVSNGITYVTAEALDGSEVVARCRVFVGMANSIALTPEELKLDIHGVSKIECSVLPESACNKAVEWSTTDDGVVAFRKNRDGSISVIGVSAGSAKILCKALDGGGACGVCDITVENR